MASNSYITVVMLGFIKLTTVIGHYILTTVLLLSVLTLSPQHWYRSLKYIRCIVQVKTELVLPSQCLLQLVKISLAFCAPLKLFFYHKADGEVWQCRQRSSRIYGIKCRIQGSFTHSCFFSVLAMSSHQPPFQGQSSPFHCLPHVQHFLGFNFRLTLLNRWNTSSILSNSSSNVLPHMMSCRQTIAVFQCKTSSTHSMRLK